jgi:DNA-binding SARP family transcriptional activator
MELDADVFVRLVRHAGEEARSGLMAAIASTLRVALGLWRGEAGDTDMAVAEALRAQLEALNRLRLVAYEDLFALQLRLDMHRHIIPEIRALLAEHSTREGLWVHLMRAYCRSGDIGTAPGAYQEFWRILDRDLGVQPGATLQRLHRSILHRDDDSI